MAKINLLRKASSFDEKTTSYRLVLEIISTEDISKYVFVKQRIRNHAKNTFEDVFAAIATPNQLEDLEINSPGADSSFFLSNQVEIVTRNADFLEQVFDDIVSSLQRLVLDTESLNILEGDGIYEIEADHIEINMAIQHTHYRLPLYATPCGINEVYNDEGEDKHRVASQNVNLTGWLNCVSGDPVGYHFKYNIDTDQGLSPRWPIDSDKITYAHLEVNGISYNDVLINADGIYWKGNDFSEAPWPADYVNSGDPGSDVNRVILVLDFIN